MTDLVIVEGVGANRLEMNTWVSASVWVSADMTESKHRGIIRDGGAEDAELFWNEWMAEEIPFLQHHQPWSRSTFIVNGTPKICANPNRNVLVELEKWNRNGA